MRVLQVTSIYYPEMKFGGPPQKIHDLSRGLVARGHEVHVVTLHSEEKRASYNRVIDGVQVQYLPWVGRGSLRLHGGFLKLWRAIEWADIVHCYGLYSLLSPFAAFFSARLKRPFILEPLGMYYPRMSNVPAKKLYHEVFTRRMISQSDVVIAASSAEAQELEPIVDAKRLVIRRNGINLEKFQGLPERGEFRRRMLISDDVRLILFLGRISPVKNIETLIHAFKEADIKNAHLILAGPMNEPDYANHLRSVVSANALTDRVSFAGALYDVDKLAALSSADLFVLPSVSESYGNAAAEAIAARIPVLLTDGCGIAPTIHSRGGLSVAPTVAGLAAGLQMLLDDAEAKKTLTRDLEGLRQELSWDEPLNQTEALYRSLLKEREM
jgi:glycosyltransferase involved in cell wall biosynthesis